MFDKKTKKDLYNESTYDMRTYIDGETAIKPYYYFRNGMIHVRYTVDRCMKLSPYETTKVKIDLTANPSDKQGVLAKAWNFYSNAVGKPVIHDGVAEMERIIEKLKDGQQD